jgi:hypothetical protein
MGLFDQDVDPDEGVTLASPFDAPIAAPQMPPMMGRPMPPPPQAPTPPQAPGPPGNLQRIISSALLGLAAGLGPRHGGAGVANGIAVGQHDNDVARQQQFQNQQTIYQNQIREQAVIAEEQRRAQVEADRRQQAFAQALNTIRNEVKTIPDKATYDERIENYANILKASGYRIDANWLRQTVRYVAPTAKEKARKALTEFYANPMVKEQIKSNPDAAMRGTMKIDLNDDGVDELVSLQEVHDAAGWSLLTDHEGAPLGMAPSADGPMTNQKVKELYEKFKAENGRYPNPGAERVAILKEAETKEKDPLTEELKAQRLADMKNKPPKPSRDPKVQARVDRLSRQFESLPVVKRTQMMSEAVSFAQGLDPNTKNPADDQALIYSFAKAMDPDSVVREGEYATVQKYAQSWADSFGFNAARIFSNTAFLTPQARKNMKTTIAAKFSAGKKQYDAVRKSYVDRINAGTGAGDGEDELTDYGAAFPQDAKATAADKLNRR